MESIIFYDGECAFCNRSVMLLYRMDRAARFRFAPLNGQTARDLLPLRQNDAPSAGSIIYLRDGISHERSTAVRKILEDLGFPFRILGLLMRIVPTRMADGLYDVVARNRHRILAEQCIIPPKGIETNRFLA